MILEKQKIALQRISLKALLSFICGFNKVSLEAVKSDIKEREIVEIRLIFSEIVRQVIRHRATDLEIAQEINRSRSLITRYAETFQTYAISDKFFFLKYGRTLDAICERFCKGLDVPSAYIIKPEFKALKRIQGEDEYELIKSVFLGYHNIKERTLSSKSQNIQIKSIRRQFAYVVLNCLNRTEYNSRVFNELDVSENYRCEFNKYVKKSFVLDVYFKKDVKSLLYKITDDKKFAEMCVDKFIKLPSKRKDKDFN